MTTIFVICIIGLLVCVTLLNWRISSLQKQIWSMEQEQRRIWQFIQRGQTGTVSEKRRG